MINDSILHESLIISLCKIQKALSFCSANSETERFICGSSSTKVSDKLCLALVEVNLFCFSSY